jgi:hypothetical protein
MQVLPFPDYALFYYGVDNFRMKNIPDNNESRLILQGLGLDFYGSVDSIKSTARSSLAGNDTIERSLKLFYLQVDKKYKKLLACNDCMDYWVIVMGCSSAFSSSGSSAFDLRLASFLQDCLGR